MSNTRTNPNPDPAHAPERNLSSARLRPINVSLALAAQAARAYDPATRAAVLWLANLAANSQRIQLCWQRRLLPDPLGTIGRITEADLAHRLGLEPIAIYRALTGSEDADLPAFRHAGEKLRATIELALPPLVGTDDTKTITAAFEAAGDFHEITELRGKWRHGKTEECERQWLRNLHRCVWLHCPEDNTERSFIFAMAQALGVSTSGGVKPTQLRDKIKRALGIGLIDTIVIDEAQNLWPSDLVGVKPVRAEFVRHLRDTLGVGFVLVTTEQFALSLELAKQHNTRYAPGQLAGRRWQYVLRDSHTDREIKAIARLHAAGPIDATALDLFCAFARAEEGYLGVMTTAVKAARRAAGLGAEITAAHATEATIAQGTNAKIVAIARGARRLRRGRFEFGQGRAA